MYAIIAGTSKAGTTSIFDYLVLHPEICPANMKETRYFLNPEYPLKTERSAGRDLSYSRLFDSDSNGSIRLEATPDYLYSEGTPGRIKQEVQDPLLIFILREPISRLISWYRFAKARGTISANLSFDDYVQDQSQLGELFPRGVEHPAFLALPHGRYSRYLERFVAVFDRSQMHIGFYDDLKENPIGFRTELCRFLQIDAELFGEAALKRINQSVSVRSPKIHRSYAILKENLRRFVNGRPLRRALLRSGGKKIEKVYRRINVRDGERLVVSAKTQKFLEDYYRHEKRELKEILGVSAPWR